MRLPYAHAAALHLPPHGDAAAPGAAVTVALCGHWEHDGPCPIAAHHTAATRDGDLLHLRILFAAEAGDEPRYAVASPWR